MYIFNYISIMQLVHLDISQLFFYGSLTSNSCCLEYIAGIKKNLIFILSYFNSSIYSSVFFSV